MDGEVAMATVSLRDVAKVYPTGITAVDGLTLDVADGELLVLVGPSGCGKTTTLRMIAGLERLTRGTIAMDGRVLGGVAPRDRDVAMVFQNHALYPHLDIRRNLAFGLRLRRVPRAESAAGWRKRPRGWESAICSDGGRPRSPGVRPSEWPSAARSSAGPRCFCWTNRWGPSTPGSETNSAARSAAFTTNCTRR